MSLPFNFWNSELATELARLLGIMEQEVEL